MTIPLLPYLGKVTVLYVNFLSLYRRDPSILPHSGILRGGRWSSVEKCEEKEKHSSVKKGKVRELFSIFVSLFHFPAVLYEFRPFSDLRTPFVFVKYFSWTPNINFRFFRTFCLSNGGVQSWKQNVPFLASFILLNTKMLTLLKGKSSYQNLRMGTLKIGKTVALFTPRKFSFSWFVRTKTVSHFAKFFISKGKNACGRWFCLLYLRIYVWSITKKKLRKK